MALDDVALAGAKKWAERRSKIAALRAACAWRQLVALVSFAPVGKRRYRARADENCQRWSRYRDAVSAWSVAMQQLEERVCRGRARSHLLDCPLRTRLRW